MLKKSKIASIFHILLNKKANFSFLNASNLVKTSFRHSYRQNQLIYLQNSIALIKLDSKSLLSKFRNQKNMFSINELIAIFSAIVTQLEIEKKTFEIHDQVKFDELLKKIMQTLLNQQEESPIIGSLILSLRNFKDINGNELLSLLDYFYNERFHMCYQEILNLMKGSELISQILGETILKQTLAKAEEIYLNEFSDFLMSLNDLEIILSIYSKHGIDSQRFLSYAEKIIELKLESNSIDLNLSLIIDCLYFFSRIQRLTITIMNYLYKILNQESEYLKLSNSKTLVRLIYVLENNKNSFENLKEDFRLFIKRTILNLQDCSFEELEILVSCLNPIDFYIEEAITHEKFKELILKKEQIQNNELVPIYSYIKTRIFFEKDLAVEEYIKLDELISKNLACFNAKDSYQFFKFFTEGNLVSKLTITFEKFPSYIVSNIQAYNFEEMCYFYFIFGKYGYLKSSGNIKENLDILRDYILLWYSSIPRGKLEITSNYYKVLEVVDINDFYMKGSWQ